ncbi:RHS repeat-associated core domain-containing protein [Pseudomonas wadenswilerensis]
MATPSRLHSNAFNFLSFVTTGTDPRTGQYTCSLSLPELSANDLCGPNIPLRLGYNPLNTFDSGFGKGWNLQLTQFDTLTLIVSLASGETFKVTDTSSSDGRYRMDEQKIESFQLYKLDEGYFRVIHKSGLIEDLRTAANDTVALPERIVSPQGHHVALTYSYFASGRMLKSIAHADGRGLLDITRGNNQVQVRLHPRTAAEALFSLVLQGSENRVARVELPTSNLASWRFEYAVLQGLLCIARVEDPLGGHEQIVYDDGHLFPGPDNRRLPRVVRHLRDPGAGQPPIDTRYEYDDFHNFLGHNAPGLIWDDSGKDNLYQVLSDYQYWTREHLWDASPDVDAARRTIERTFNRFHLIVDEVTEQGECVKQVRTDYPILAGRRFEDQPAQCQLPTTVTTSWHLKSTSGHRREDVVRQGWDKHGNQILLVHANGISESSEYYEANGEDGCPADPHGFVRYLKNRTVTPASADFGDAPSLRSHYRYLELPPIVAGEYPWVAQELEVLTQVQGNVELQRTRQHYLVHPGDPFQHGRVAQTEVILNNKGTYTDFFYSKVAARRADETVMRTVEVLRTSFDQATKTITHERSLLNGQTLLELDDNDVEIAYRYDLLGRVIEETVAPGSNDFKASRHYSYILVAQRGNQASQTAIDVKGVATRSDIDGLQRVIEEWRQDVDGDPVNKPWRQTFAARYDRFGKLHQSDEIDWLGKHDMTLTRSFTYDDWNEQDSETGPDGVTSRSLNDPVNRRQRTWEESRDGQRVDLREVEFDRFEKPLSEERFDRQGKPVSMQYQRYDGLGRCRQRTDALNHSTFYVYDAWSRVTRTVLPDATRIARAYAEHSSDELPVHLAWETDDAPVLLGEQCFDGLQRLTSLSVGPRQQSWIYKGGRPQPSEHRTAAGKHIFYEYNPRLSSSPTLLTAPDENASYGYDRLDAQLNSAQNERGCREFEYDSWGHLVAEHWTEDGQTWSASHEHSRAGRKIAHQDVNGLHSGWEYDACGRLERLTQGRLQVDYCYDGFSRPFTSTCRDLDAGTELVTTLTYDDWGREIERRLAPSGQPEQSIHLEYRLDDRLGSRHRRRAGTILLQEQFEYDERGRLTEHLCTGTQLPRDRHGNPISAQVFTFDALDNLCSVHTLLADGREDTCTRSFATDDPCLLVKVQHSLADYPPSLDLLYDADGNLRFDEDGRALYYDSQSRLLRVESPGGEVLTRYHYDAHNQLCGETHDSAEPTLRFYQGQRLGCTVQGQTRVSYLHEGDRPLGQQQAGAPEQTLLLLTTANRSVIGESQQQALRETSYSAWGQHSNADMQCALGFNGELRDSLTGWYLLGNGYRAYNPYLMCFHGPDWMSPFGAGGINPYMYCAGDPVNFCDPSGHFMQGTLGWVGFGLGIVGTAISAGAAGPAFSAIIAGAAGAGEFMTAVSVISGVVAIGTQGAAAAIGDKHTQSVLGVTAHAAGWISLVSGFGGLWKRDWQWRPTKPASGGQAPGWINETIDPRYRNNFLLRTRHSVKRPGHQGRLDSMMDITDNGMRPRIPSTPTGSPTSGSPQSTMSLRSNRHRSPINNGDEPVGQPRPTIDDPATTTNPSTNIDTSPTAHRNSGPSTGSQTEVRAANVRANGQKTVTWPTVNATYDTTLTWNNNSVSTVRR